jgi:hypothetical protein
MWPHTKDGVYTVKSGYNLIKHWHDSSNPSSASSNSYSQVWKKLWNLKTILWHKVLLWRIVQRALPVTSELSKRGITCPILCPRCLQKEETLNHVFMECHLATMTWFGSKLGIRFDTSHDNFIDWLIYNISTHRLAHTIWYNNLSLIHDHSYWFMEGKFLNSAAIIFYIFLQK